MQRLGIKSKSKQRTVFVTTGIVIPRYEHADSEYIVLKLKSGYNIGLRAGNIKKIKVLEVASLASEDRKPYFQSSDF